MRKLIALLLVLTVTTIASAGSVNTPNTFVAGTKAKSSEVNANFTAVETSVNDNDTRITSNSTTLGSNSSNISNNTSSITANSSNITENTSNITTNTSNISTNDTNIADLANRSWGKSGNDLFYNDGNVGVGTAVPSEDLHIADGDAVVRLTSTATGGRTWDLHSRQIDGSFRITDFVDPTSFIERFVISDTGNVGIGTTNPTSRLHILETVGSQIELDGGPLGDSGILFHNKSGNTAHFRYDGDTNAFEFRTNGTSPADIKVVITDGGTVGIGTTNPQGALDVNGPIFQRGGQLHADYVFNSKYRLESIEEHAKFMWNKKHLKAVPKANLDKKGREVLEVGAHRRGILEELEKAHIYIEQLHKHMKVMEERLVKLESSSSSQGLRAEINQ